MVAQDPMNIIATEILVDARKAVAELKRFQQEVDKTALSVYTAKQKAKGVANEFSAGFPKAKKSIQETNKELQNSQAQLGNMANASKSAFDQVFTSVNAVRIALGALVSMILFRAIQGIEEFFKGAIKNATEFEDTLFRLRNVEIQLSDAGVNVSLAGLKKGIQEIREELRIFSKEDIAGVVGKLAISTKDLRLTEQQILDLSKAVAILNVRSTENETLNQTASKIVTSLLTDQSKGVSNLGIQLGETNIKVKAMELGFLRAGESVDELTKHEKELAKIQIVIDSANGELQTFAEYMATSSARIKENEAAWKDLQTTIGQTIVPFIPALTAVIDAIESWVNTFKTLLAVVQQVQGILASLFQLIATGKIKSIDDLKSALVEIEKISRKIVGNLFFPEGLPSDAPEWAKRLFPDEIFEKETTTGAPGIDREQQEEDQKKAKEHGEKLADIMQDNADKLADINRDYARKIEDINRDFGEKMVDITRDTAEKREDAERDYLEKVEDINRSAAEKVAKAQQDAQKKEIDREAEFQRRLRELREKFLFDLEDALRERDARQVLRLVRQYQMDKKSLEEKRKLDREEAKKDLAQKLQDIELERQQELAEARRTYEQKKADIDRQEARARADANRWRQRQLADARLWYQRQLADQREFLQRKLADLAAAYAQEAALHQSMINQVGTATTTVGMGVQVATPTVSSTNPNFYQPYWGSVYGAYGLAEGGTIVAKKPTLAMFGENGDEIATFRPLNRNGRNNALSSDMQGGGMNGALDLKISISQGLIAEIVDSSLERVATHIEHTRRLG